MKSPETSLFRRALPVTAIALVALTACNNSKETAATTTVSIDTAADDGCETFRVYSQNRFEPYGTAIREEPDVLSDKAGSFAPNEVIAVDGWYDSGKPIYPTNSEPWDSSVWFRLDYDNLEGWVSFPGVRLVPSSPDETGGFSEYGGEPVPLLSECEIFVD